MRFGSVDAEDQTRIRVGHPAELPMPYLRTAALGLVATENLHRALIIGLGGGAFASYLQARHPQVIVDAVEIDPVVAQLAQDHFSLTPTERLRVHVIDAVDFVRELSRSYDYILLDAYDADDIPAALMTDDFLRNVKGRLNPGGVVVANIAISGYLETRRVIGRFVRHYKHCLRLNSTPSYNDVLFLSDRPIPSAPELAARARRLETEPEPMAGIQQQVDTARACL